jgi:predicted GNAT family N-acyltransferase
MNSAQLIVRKVDWQCEKERLLRIRCAVFVDEQGFPLELEVDEHDASAWHYVAEVDSLAVATARCSSTGQVGRMAVLPAYRRLGIGGALLQTLIQQMAGHGLLQLHLNAQLPARRFYSHYGFVATGPRFMDHGVEHCRMDYLTETAPS